jgi:hypothetical protein
MKKIVSTGIVVTITRKRLVELRACAEGKDSGMALFESLRAMQGRRHSVRIRLDLLAQLWLATACPGHYRWLVENGLLPVLGMARANLARAYLTGANLTRADLAGANLTRADLAGANLDGANLARANLTRANLDGANLTRANLARANLTRANLDGAYLTGANLARANLTRAYLTGANLDRAYLDGANLTRADLAGANLDGANLAGANLAGAYRPVVSWGCSDLPDGWERDEGGYLRRPVPR